MRRQDEQAGVVHAHALHEHVVGRMTGRERTAGGRREFVAVVAGRLVAMVAVGDEYRLRAHGLLNLGDRFRVGQRPHPVLHAEVIFRFHTRATGNRRFGDLLGLVRRVGEQAEDLREVRLASLGQHETIGLRAGERLFVRVDIALAETLELHAAHEAAARVGAAGIIERLMVDVDRGLRFRMEHPFAAPVLQILGGAGVLVRLVVVARLFAVEFQAHEVRRVLLVELLLKLRADHVVRRSR